MSLQNGLNEDAIARRIGRDRTVGAFVNLFADVIGPGEIRDGGQGALVVGELDGRDSRRVREVVARPAGVGSGPGHRQRLRLPVVEAGVRRHARRDRARRRPDGRAHRPAPGGDARAGRGGLRGRRGGGGHAGALRRVRPGCPTRATTTPRRSAATDALVAWLRTQAKDRSGIWRDIAVRHRPTEVPTHYRPVLAAAARHGIPVPGLERLVAQIGELESGAAMDEARIAAPRAVRCDDRGAARRPRSTASTSPRCTGGSTAAVRSSWTTSSPTPSWRRRATTSRC